MSFELTNIDILFDFEQTARLRPRFGKPYAESILSDPME